MFRITSLGGFSVASGKWKLEVYPSPGTNIFTAGDDVDAKLVAARREITKHGGVVTEESGHWTGSGVDVYFTAPRGFQWPYSWGKFEKYQTIQEKLVSPILDDAEKRAERQRQEALDDAEALAERQREAAMRDAQRLADQQRAAAEAQARQLMEETDKRAGARLTQARDMAIWGGIIIITFGTVAYIAVMD